jgi:hypothetical protein
MELLIHMCVCVCVCVDELKQILPAIMHHVDHAHVNKI